jgi:hypothetical protein
LPLFDVRDRTDDHPKTRGEGLFAFYDRMSRRPLAITKQEEVALARITLPSLGREHELHAS